VAMNGFIEMFEVNSNSLRSDISDILGYVMTADVYHQVLIVCSIECIEEILRMVPCLYLFLNICFNLRLSLVLSFVNLIISLDRTLGWRSG